jgi:selenocysteine lyase/cysteine desulfurase
MTVNFDRRSMLQGLALAGGTLAAGPRLALAAPGAEPDWERVRSAYAPQSALMNLNNASVSPTPLAVQEVVIKAYRFANGEPDVNMWDRLDGALPGIKAKLAVLADCDPSEIALDRNSSEALCTAIFGIPLKAGDEALLSDWDYPSMCKAFEQRSKREGITVKRVVYGLQDSDDVIVDAYTRAIGPRSKVMLLTHLVHWTGRVLPVERLCALAKQHTLVTVVDAAQSFAHLPFSFRKLGCDYLATSLHKWLCAPLGNGMLIVKAERIDETWPLLAPFDPEPLRIEKFDHWNLGTYCSPLQTGIEAAVDFHNTLGTARVHARLRELSRHWVQKASDIKGFRIHTPMDSPELGAVTLFSIQGMDPEAVEKQLREQHKIRVRFRRQGTLAGVRVSPHIYTSKGDLDRFVSAVRQVAQTA